MTSRRLAIPRELRIKGRRWRVRHMTPKAKRGRMRGLEGLCEIEARIIDIDGALDRVEQERTFVHEVLHALWPEGVVPDAVEERIVRRLEKPLHSLLLSGALAVAPEEVA